MLLTDYLIQIMELKGYLQRFREWQRQPIRYTNKSTGPTTCQNCGTVFDDNFCPRCGQKAGVGRIDIQVFMSVQILLLSSILSLSLGWYSNDADIFFIPIYYIITYKQLFGYHWWGTIWRFAVCIIATAALLSLIIVILMH